METQTCRSCAKELMLDEFDVVKGKKHLKKTCCECFETMNKKKEGKANQNRKEQQNMKDMVKIEERKPTLEINEEEDETLFCEIFSIPTDNTIDIDKKYEYAHLKLDIKLTDVKKLSEYTCHNTKDAIKRDRYTLNELAQIGDKAEQIVNYLEKYNIYMVINEIN